MKSPVTLISPRQNLLRALVASGVALLAMSVTASAQTAAVQAAPPAAKEAAPVVRREGPARPGVSWPRRVAA